MPKLLPVFWMPLNRKTVCPEVVPGACGTVQVVEKAVIGVAAPLSHQAYVCHPSGNAAGTTVGDDRGASRCAVGPRPGPKARNGTLIAGGAGILMRRFVASSILSIAPCSWISPKPGSTRWTKDLGRKPPGVRTRLSAIGVSFPLLSSRRNVPDRAASHAMQPVIVFLTIRSYLAVVRLVGRNPPAQRLPEVIGRRSRVVQLVQKELTPGIFCCFCLIRGVCNRFDV